MSILSVTLKIEGDKGLVLGGVLLTKALCSDADYEHSYLNHSSSFFTKRRQ